MPATGPAEPVQGGAVAAPGRAAAILANAGALAAAKAAGTALLLAWQVLLARQLGVELYGVYATIAALLAVGAAIPDPGVGVVHVRDAARYPDRAGRYLGAALALHTGLAAAAWVVLQAAGTGLGYDDSLRALLALAACSLLVDVVGTTAHNQLVASERLALSAAIGTAHVALVVSAGGAVLALGGSLREVYVAVIACGVVRTAAFWIAVTRTGVRISRPIDRGLAADLLRAGLPLGAAAALGLALRHADKILATALIGAAATSQLMIAFVIVFGIVELTGTTLLVAALPAMARMSGQGSAARLASALRHLLIFNATVGVPAAVLLAGFGGALAVLLFGAPYGAAGTIFPVLGLYLLVHLVEGSLAQMLTVQDRQPQVLAARAAGLSLALAATVGLLPRLGVVGAAWGMLAGGVVTCALMARSVGLPARWWAELGRHASRLAVPAALMAALVWALAPALPGAALALAAYAVAVAGSGAVPPEQRQALAELAGTVPGVALARRWIGV